MDKSKLEHLTHGAALIGAVADPLQHLLLTCAVARGAMVPTADLDALGSQLRSGNSMNELTAVLCGETARAIGLDRRVAEAIAAGRLVPTSDRFLERILLAKPSLADEASTIWARNGIGGVNDLAAVFQVLGINGADPVNAAGAVLTRSLGKFSLSAFMGAAYKSDAAELNALALPLMAELETRLRAQLGKVPAQTSFDDFAGRASMPTSASSGLAAPLQSTAVALRVMSRFLPPELRQRTEEISGYVQGAVQVAEAMQLIAAAGSGWGAAMAIAGLAGGLGNMRLPGLGGDAQVAARHEQLMQAIESLMREMRQEFAKVNSKLDSMIASLEEIIALLRTQSASIAILQNKLDGLARDVDTVQAGIYRIEYAIEAGAATNTHREFAGIIALEGETPFATEQQFLHALDFYADHGNRASGQAAQPVAGGTDRAERLNNARKLVLERILGSAEAADRWLAVRALTDVLEIEYGCPEFGNTVHEPQLRFALQNLAGVKLADSVRFRQLLDRPAAGQLISRHLGSMREQILNHRTVMSNLLSPREPGVQGAQTDFRRGSPFWVLLKHYETALTALETLDLQPLYARVFDDHLDELTHPGAAGNGQQSVQLDIFAGNPDKHGLSVEVFGPVHTTGHRCAVAPLYTAIWTDGAGVRQENPLTVGLYGMHVVSIEPADEGLRSNYVDFDTEVRLRNQQIARFTMSLKLHYGGLRKWENDPPRLAQYQGLLSYTHEPFMRIAAADDYWYVPSGKEGILGQVLGKALNTDACRNNAKQVLRSVVPLTSWAGRQAYLGRALAQGDTFDWRDGARATYQALRERIGKLQEITKMLQAVCMIAYGPLYDQADVLRALLEGDSSTRVIDAEVLQSWGKLVAGLPDGAVARLANSIDTSVDTDYANTRYRHFVDLARQRYGQLRTALTLLSEAGSKAGPFFPFEQACTQFERTFSEELAALI